MKIATKFIYRALAGLALTCFGLSPMAQAQLQLPSASANLFVSINGLTNDNFQDQNFAGAIFQYTPTGTRNGALHGLSRPRGLAFDSAGKFFAATTFSLTRDSSGNDIEIFARQTKQIRHTQRQLLR